jgi:hypothetical protein
LAVVITLKAGVSFEIFFDLQPPSQKTLITTNKRAI